MASLKPVADGKKGFDVDHALIVSLNNHLGEHLGEPLGELLKELLGELPFQMAFVFWRPSCDEHLGESPSPTSSILEDNRFDERRFQMDIERLVEAFQLMWSNFPEPPG